MSTAVIPGSTAVIPGSHAYVKSHVIQSSAERMPNELWAKVFGYLPGEGESKDLLNASLVNKTWAANARWV